jgi:HlyD family secretion protein
MKLSPTTIRPHVSAVRRFIRGHTVLTVIIGIAIVGGGYALYRMTASTSASSRYVLGAVTRGTLVSSLSATGQVSASNQVDIHPKSSGQITAVYAKVGKSVREGAVLATLDPGDAGTTVRDAQLNLESAQLALQKIQQPDNAAATLSANNALASAQTSVNEAYADSFTTVSNAYLDLPTVVTGLDDILNNDTHSPYMSDTRMAVYAGGETIDEKRLVTNHFYAARDAYQAALNQFHNTERTTSTEGLSSLLTTTQNATQGLSDVLHETDTLIQRLNDAGAPKDETSKDTATLSTYATTLDNTIAKLRSGSDAIASAKRALTEKQQAEKDVTKGADSADLRSAEINVEERQNALQTAQNELAKYTVRAPFSGIIAASDAHVGDDAGASTVIATIITTQKIAAVTLNEVDVVKVQEGQKATLTFDALPDLTLTGKVLQVNGVGTATQGVVSYAVQIGFDTGDDKVKPGMSVSASIITQSRPDTLIVLSGAVHTTGGSPTVQMLDNPSAPAADGSVSSPSAPRSVPVEVGLSNDTQTEILSGLAEGDQVVVRTITAAQQSAASMQRPTTNTLFGPTRGAGGGGAAGGARTGGGIGTGAGAER